MTLQEVIVYDPIKNPERGNATIERIEEIINIIVVDSTRAKKVLNQCKTALQKEMQKYAPLTRDEGIRIADILTGEFEQDELQAAINLLYESELSTQEVIEIHRKKKIPVSHLEDDLLPVRGMGAKIRDSKGKIYIDLDSNYSATNLGNANPEIARGLFNQASLLISQKEDRIQVARTRFLKEIADMLPKGLDHFYWQNSGGEAVDKSLKIAKAYTGQTGVLAFKGGFHGRTHGAVAVTYNEKYRKPFGLHLEPWVHFVPFGDLNSVEAMLQARQAEIVILELVQGEEAGISPATQEFASGLRSLCDLHGAILIADEVQTGFGRVAGKQGEWFASHRYNIVPDIITIGKSFGGGYPVTAVVTNEKISDAMHGGYDGSTFGGNPMAMTAALIATRQMKTLDLTVNTVARSEQFAKGLAKIKLPQMIGYRTIGLMIGIDLDSPETVAKVQEAMKKYGAHSSLSTGATMRWMPPLVITAAETEQVLNAFKQALNEI